MSIDKVEHFVVLMLENRSFDHMFGFRKGVEGVPAGAANPTGHGAPIEAAQDAPFEIPTKHALGPLHNVVDVNVQLFGEDPPPANANPTMTGFVKSYHHAFAQDVRREPTREELSLVMRSFSPKALPAIWSLAEHFVLCDHWFCEVPGPTHPNRLYVHAGTSAGFAHNVFEKTFNLVTIYELLHRAGKSWATYSFDKNEVMHFSRIAHRLDGFRHFDPNFFEDVDRGDLPNYSFVVPRFMSTKSHPSNSQHAPHDVRYGDHLIADIYDALRANEALWEKTAFIVTYDEHGGFYDHVPPPAAKNPDGIDSPRPDDHGKPGHSSPPTFTFDRLGLRVPTIIASPWVPAHVEKAELQHTSILATVRKRFGITRALSKREAHARTFEALFSEKKPRSNVPERLPRPTLPRLAPPDHHANPANWSLDDLQREIRDGIVAMTRPSHPKDGDGIWLPKTQGETSEFIRQRITRHRQYLRRSNP